MRPDTPDRYDRLAVAFHWLSVLLVALAYLTIELRGPHTSPYRDVWIGMHVWAGTLLWITSVARLAWRFKHGAPPPAPGHVMVIRLSRLVHGALYGFVLVQPLLGMLIYNLSGKPIPFAGLPWSLTLVGTAPNLWHDVKDIHEFIGNAFYGVIGLHACAALFHHFLLRDNTMRRMRLG